MDISQWLIVAVALFAAAGTWSAALGGFIGWLHRKATESQIAMRDEFKEKIVDIKDHIEHRATELRTQNATDHALVRQQISEVQIDLREHRLESRAEIARVNDRINSLFQPRELRKTTG